MSHAAHHDTHAPVVDLLPAGAKESHGPGHHGHTIVSMRTLVVVLAILLFFTFLTVAAANAEMLFARLFDVHIPGWVNVLVALSIAAVKSVIVAMYFMQLRYDHNPMNALVAVFTVMVLTFFLGFTAIDLGNRGIIYQEKGQHIIPGGTGGITRGRGDSTEQIPPGTSIAMHARQKADRLIEQALATGETIHNHAYTKRLYIHYHELMGTPDLQPVKAELAAKMKAYMQRHPAEFEKIAREMHAHGHAEHALHGNTASTARPRTGLTSGLLDGNPIPPAAEPAAPKH